MMYLVRLTPYLLCKNPISLMKKTKVPKICQNFLDLFSFTFKNSPHIFLDSRQF